MIFQMKPKTLKIEGCTVGLVGMGLTTTCVWLNLCGVSGVYFSPSGPQSPIAEWGNTRWLWNTWCPGYWKGQQLHKLKLCDSMSSLSGSLSTEPRLWEITTFSWTLILFSISLGPDLTGLLSHQHCGGAPVVWPTMGSSQKDAGLWRFIRGQCASLWSSPSVA